MSKNNKEDIILNALLAYPTIKQASEASGVPEPTIYAKLRDDDFKQRYNEVKNQMLNNTVSFLQVKLQEATTTIIDIMNDVEIAAQTRLNAARSVFDYFIKLNEQTEILSRLEALEVSHDDES